MNHNNHSGRRSHLSGSSSACNNHQTGIPQVHIQPGTPSIPPNLTAPSPTQNRIRVPEDGLPQLSKQSNTVNHVSKSCNSPLFQRPLPPAGPKSGRNSNGGQYRALKPGEYHIFQINSCIIV